MTVITMSRNELTRLRMLIDIADGRLSVVDATELIDVGQMKIYRLLLVVTVVIVFFYVHHPNGYLLSLKVVAVIWAVAPPTWFAFEWYITGYRQ